MKRKYKTEIEKKHIYSCNRNRKSIYIMKKYT